MVVVPDRLRAEVLRVNRLFFSADASLAGVPAVAMMLVDSGASARRCGGACAAIPATRG